jgi:hypothetical protein
MRVTHFEGNLLKFDRVAYLLYSTNNLLEEIDDI